MSIKFQVFSCKGAINYIMCALEGETMTIDYQCNKLQLNKNLKMPHYI